MAGIKEEVKRWEETTVKKALDRFPERKKRFTSTSHLEFKRLFTPEDLEEFDYISDLGFPGEYPFTLF